MKDEIDGWIEGWVREEAGRENDGKLIGRATTQHFTIWNYFIVVEETKASL